jgi:hypothetical protein
MSEDEQLEMIIEQTINGAIAAIPAQLEEVNQSKDILKVENPNEFVFGIIMGMALGMAGALMTAQRGIPTLEDQLKVRDLVYKKIRSIREQIFK